MDGDDQNRFGRRRTRKIAPGGSVTRTIPPQALIDAINHWSAASPPPRYTARWTPLCFCFM